jgi:hypothetical protein
VILTKHDVHFIPSTFQPTGRKHSFGWKKHGKATIASSDTYYAFLRITKTALLEKGWTLETDGIPVEAK